MLNTEPATACVEPMNPGFLTIIENNGRERLVYPYYVNTASEDNTVTNQDKAV